MQNTEDSCLVIVAPSGTRWHRRSEEKVKSEKTKRGSSARPLPAEPRKTAVCPQLDEIWCVLFCLPVPKDMFVIAASKFLNNGF